MKIKIEDLIDITNKVDHILHDYGFCVNHDILSTYLLKTIKKSYPNDIVELERLGGQIIKNLE